MIEIAFNDYSKDRTEGARVFLPGFEYLESFAVPYCKFKGHASDDRWMIVDAITGYRLISSDVENGYADIDAAIAGAVAYCKMRNVTREKYEARIQAIAAEWEAAKHAPRRSGRGRAKKRRPVPA